MALEAERSLVLMLQPTGVKLITGLSSSYDAMMPPELIEICSEAAWTDAMLKINKYDKQSYSAVFTGRTAV
jgi:hypothetical protein